MGAAFAALWLLGRLGMAGRAVRHAVLWGGAALALYLALPALGAPAILRVPPNPYTVGAAAVLGAPGIGLAVLTHWLYR